MARPSLLEATVNFFPRHRFGPEREIPIRRQAGATTRVPSAGRAGSNRLNSAEPITAVPALAFTPGCGLVVGNMHQGAPPSASASPR